MDELVQKIGKLGRKMKGLAQQAVKEYSVEVELIINSQGQDSQRIELCLDYMLDFCFDEGMLNLYKKLCRYYFSFNQQAAVSYVNAYREMWDDQTIKDTGVIRKYLHLEKYVKTSIWIKNNLSH